MSRRLCEPGFTSILGQLRGAQTPGGRCVRARAAARAARCLSDHVLQRNDRTSEGRAALSSEHTHGTPLRDVRYRNPLFHIHGCSMKELRTHHLLHICGVRQKIPLIGFFPLFEQRIQIIKSNFTDLNLINFCIYLHTGI